MNGASNHGSAVIIRRWYQDPLASMRTVGHFFNIPISHQLGQAVEGGILVITHVGDYHTVGLAPFNQAGCCLGGLNVDQVLGDGKRREYSKDSQDN